MTILPHSTPVVQPMPASALARLAFWLPLVQAGVFLILALCLAGDVRPFLLTLLELLSGAVLAWGVNAAGCWLIAKRCRRG